MYGRKNCGEGEGQENENVNWNKGGEEAIGADLAAHLRTAATATASFQIKYGISELHFAR